MHAVGAALTSVAEAVLGEALRIVLDTTGVEVPIAVIAMGRFGGAELSYASDLDVMVVHGGHTDDEAALAERAATELRRLLNGATPAERLYTIDFDLRPEGKQGPLARSLAGYAQYYDRWAGTWERQALLRGRFAVGDEAVGARFAELATSFLSRDLTAGEERDIRRLKARIERERIPAGDDPDFHLKLGRGGLSDVEWTIQLLQLRHHLLGHPGTLRRPRRPGTDRAHLAARRPGARRRLRLLRADPQPAPSGPGHAGRRPSCPSRPSRRPGPQSGHDRPGTARRVQPGHASVPGGGGAPVLRGRLRSGPPVAAGSGSQGLLPAVRC